jgi:hypothetical protein
VCKIERKNYKTLKITLAMEVNDAFGSAKEPVLAVSTAANVTFKYCVRARKSQAQYTLLTSAVRKRFARDFGIFAFWRLGTA